MSTSEFVATLSRAQVSVISPHPEQERGAKQSVAVSDNNNRASMGQIPPHHHQISPKSQSAPRRKATPKPQVGRSKKATDFLRDFTASACTAPSPLGKLQARATRRILQQYGTRPCLKKGFVPPLTSVVVHRQSCESSGEGGRTVHLVSTGQVHGLLALKISVHFPGLKAVPAHPDSYPLLNPSHLDLAIPAQKDSAHVSPSQHSHHCTYLVAPHAGASLPPPPLRKKVLVHFLLPAFL